MAHMQDRILLLSAREILGNVHSANKWRILHDGKKIRIFCAGGKNIKLLNTKNNKWNNNIIMVMISTVDLFRIRKTVNPTDHSLCDQLPVGLLAQLVKQCTGIAQVMGSNSVKVWFFLRLYFYYCTRRLLSYLRLYLQFTYIIFIYLQSFFILCESSGLVD